MKMIQYSYNQIRHILAEQGLYLETIYRYKERIRHYDVKRIGTEEIVWNNVTLNYIRCYLTRLRYPADYEPKLPKKKKV